MEASSRDVTHNNGKEFFLKCAWKCEVRKILKKGKKRKNYREGEKIGIKFGGKKIENSARRD